MRLWWHYGEVGCGPKFGYSHSSITNHRQSTERGHLLRNCIPVRFWRHGSVEGCVEHRDLRRSWEYFPCHADAIQVRWVVQGCDRNAFFNFLLCFVIHLSGPLNATDSVFGLNMFDFSFLTAQHRIQSLPPPRFLKIDIHRRPRYALISNSSYRQTSNLRRRPRTEEHKT